MDTSLLDAQPTAKYPTGSNKIAVLMAIVAALGPLDFGVTLGFTSPSIIGMEAGANGTWASEAVFDDAVVIKGEVSYCFAHAVRCRSMFMIVLTSSDNLDNSFTSSTF